MQPKQPTAKHIGIVIAGAIILWILAWAAMVLFLPNYETRGQFGDMFGAVNSLFSGLAMAGVIYTVWLQTKEIEAQRTEQKANEEFRQTQIDALNINISATREQLQLMRMEGAPAIQWKSILRETNAVKYTFLNKGGRLKITEVRILNSPIVGADWCRLFASSDEKGWVLLKFNDAPSLPIPQGGLLFELHYQTTFGQEYRRYRIIGDQMPVEDE